LVLLVVVLLLVVVVVLLLLLLLAFLPLVKLLHNLLRCRRWHTSTAVPDIFKLLRPVISTRLCRRSVKI
jgi:hypothetical protein